MRIVSSKRINFLISNIFEKYYEPIQEELSCSGLVEDLAHKVIQEILAMIYRRAMDEGIETEEELDVMAVDIINDRLERVLVPYYAQKYVERFSFDKVALENGMLNRIQGIKNSESNAEQVEQPNIQETRGNSPEQEQREYVEDEADKTENIEKQYLYDDVDDCDDVEIIDLRNERKETPVVRRMEEPRIRRFRVNGMLIILALLLVTIVPWFIVGILMGRGYLPRVDLGYTWFNSHIWSIF